MELRDSSSPAESALIPTNYILHKHRGIYKYLFWKLTKLLLQLKVELIL